MPLAVVHHLYHLRLLVFYHRVVDPTVAYYVSSPTRGPCDNLVLALLRCNRLCVNAICVSSIWFRQSGINCETGLRRNYKT